MLRLARRSFFRLNAEGRAIVELANVWASGSYGKPVPSVLSSLDSLATRLCDINSALASPEGVSVPFLGELAPTVADAASKLGAFLDGFQPEAGRIQKRLAQQLLSKAAPGTTINLDLSAIDNVQGSTVILRSTVKSVAEAQSANSGAPGDEAKDQGAQAATPNSAGGQNMAEGTTGGDNISNIQNSTVIYRSTIENALNKIQSKADPDEIADAIAKATEAVAKSGNKQASDLMSSFKEEVAKPTPSKGVLKTLWDGVVAALPTVKEIAEVAGIIAKLFV
jgi:hypothetical protein